MTDSATLSSCEILSIHNFLTFLSLLRTLKSLNLPVVAVYLCKLLLANLEAFLFSYTEKCKVKATIWMLSWNNGTNGHFPHQNMPAATYSRDI